MPTSQIAAKRNAAVALPDYARTSDPERKKHGPDRAKGGGDRRCGNCAAHFRAHDCRSWSERSRAKAGEMAADRDRSGQAMRTKLAADHSNAAKIEGILPGKFCSGGLRPPESRKRRRSESAATRSSFNRLAPTGRRSLEKN